MIEEYELVVEISYKTKNDAMSFAKLQLSYNGPCYLTKVAVTVYVQQ